MRIIVAAISLTVFGAAVGAATQLAPLPGTWSFDGSCASGDGMQLKADGSAAFDEWGQGLWASADNDARIVIIVKNISEEADRPKNAQLVEFRVTGGVGNRMSLMRLSDGAKIEAVRCGD